MPSIFVTGHTRLHSFHIFEGPLDVHGLHLLALTHPVLNPPSFSPSVPCV